jgi:hypothetical protein
MCSNCSVETPSSLGMLFVTICDETYIEAIKKSCDTVSICLSLYDIEEGRIQINKLACNKAMRGEGKRGGNGKFVAYHI